MIPGMTWAEQVDASTSYTAARQFTSDGSKRYSVWIRRGGATIVHVYEAASADDAIQQARDELAMVEAALNRAYAETQE